MSAAKKKQQAAPRFRTPEQRTGDVLKNLKPIVGDDEAATAAAHDAARAFDEQAEYEMVYARLPKGRPRDGAEPMKRHIRELLDAHPTLANKPAALWEHRDKSIVGSLGKKRWANLVGEVRKNV